MNKQDPRASRSRRALLDSTISLFLSNPHATMSDIASHAGIGRATLYRHFETREKLILALAMESLELTDQVLEPIRVQNLTAMESLTKGLHAIMPLANRFHFLISLWNVCSENNTEVMAIYNRQLEQLAEVIEQGKREKSIDNGISTNWIVLLIDSLIYMGWWSISTGEQTAEQAAELAVISLFKGVAPQ